MLCSMYARQTEAVASGLKEKEAKTAYEADKSFTNWSEATLRLSCVGSLWYFRERNTLSSHSFWKASIYTPFSSVRVISLSSIAAEIPDRYAERLITSLICVGGSGLSSKEYISLETTSVSVPIERANNSVCSKIGRRISPKPKVAKTSWALCSTRFHSAVSGGNKSRVPRIA